MDETLTLAPRPFCGNVPTLKPSTVGNYTSIVCPAVCAGPLVIAIPNDRLVDGLAVWNRRAHNKLMPIMHTGMWISFDVLDERQAQRNHGQTLARLAERGGLNAAEALAIAERRAYKPVHTKDAIVALSALAAPTSHQADAAEMLLRRLVQRHRAGRDLVQPEEWPAIEAVAMRNASPLR